MPQINLLPWREQIRQIKKKHFGIIVAICVGITLFLIFLLHIHYKNLINYQIKRNTFLQGELSKEQNELGVLNKKKNAQLSVDTELKFISVLREKSYRAVRMLDALVRVVPEGIALNKIIRDDNNIIILGKAQSEIQITYFMKNLAQSNIFEQPVLTEINSKQTSSGAETEFELRVKQEG